MSKLVQIVKKNYKLVSVLLVVIVAIVAVGSKKVTYSNDVSDGVNINCQEEIEYNKNFVCDIFLNSSLLVPKGISFNYMFSDKIKIINFAPAAGWKIVDDNTEDSGIVLVNLDNENEFVEIGNIELLITDNISSDYEIGLKDIIIGDGEITTAKLDDLTTEITVESDNLNYEISFDQSLVVDYDNKYINNLYVGNTVDDLISKINIEEGYVIIYDNNDNIKEVDELISTGDILKSYFRDELKEEYQLSLIGDSNGDGIFNTSDLYLWRQHYVGNNKLSGVYEETLDFDSNGKVNTSDLFNIRKAIVNGYNNTLNQLKKG
jgi:hypothetical protein